MNKKIMLQSGLTLTLFLLINWGVWEVLVMQGMEEPWASFTVYAVLIVIVISIWHKPLFEEWIRFKNETKNLKKSLFYVKHNRNIYSSIIMHAMMNLPGAILMIIGII